MPIFFYHPKNSIAKDLKEISEQDGFIYKARPHMEMILKDHLLKAGYDISPEFYCSIGSLAGTLQTHIALNPDNEFHRIAEKACKNKTPWAYVKINNGRRMKFVIGYCNSDPSTPFLLSNVQMAQSGLINSSFVPR